MEINYDKIYALLEKEKNNIRVKFLLDNLEFFNNVCNYVLSKNVSEDYEFKKLDNMNPEESFKIANDVLMDISANYPIIMNSYKKENKIKITDESNNRIGSGDANLINNELVINYGLHHDLFDIFLIVHEFMHSLNAKDEETPDSKLLSEAFAVYSEYLTYNYLERNNIETNVNNEMPKLRMSFFYKRIKQLKFYIDAINYIKQNPHVINKDKKVEADFYDEVALIAGIDYSFASIVSMILLNRNSKDLFSNEDYVKYNSKIKDSNQEVINEIFPNGLDINEFIEAYQFANLFVNKNVNHKKI